MTGSEETFDVIVVGAGSSGCALAGRLSENPQLRVLLLEAGPADRNPWIHVPIGYYKTIFNPKLGWGYQTEADPGLGGRSILWPRGKVLGGSSSINGLAWVRGQAEDYNHWRQLGNAGWAYEEVLPYFKRIEAFAEGDDALRGRHGPIGVYKPSRGMELMDAFIRAANEAGIPTNPDYNGAEQAGVGYFQLSIRGGFRCSAATAYLRPARRRPNLRVETGALTTGLVLDGRRVVGVVYERGGHQQRVRARREVVLSAGAIGSPQILMLSGIGPEDVLARHGIEVRHALSGVGRNLQDHFQARAVYRCPRPITLNDVGNSLWRRTMAGLEWGIRRTGPLMVGAGVVTLFWNVLPESATPDVQFHVIPFSTDKPGEPLHAFSGYTISVCQLRPESRGRIELRSADPREPPAIHPNYLATETDRRTMVEGVKLIRRIMDQKAIAPYRDAELVPGTDCRSDEQLLGFVRSFGTTIFHPTSTCMMGLASNPLSVVDARLKVHGLEGLRVADASIMPTVVSGNTNAPCIMIGEKCADLIRDELGLRAAA